MWLETPFAQGITVAAGDAAGEVSGNAVSELPCSAGVELAFGECKDKLSKIPRTSLEEEVIGSEVAKLSTSGILDIERGIDGV